MVPQYRSLRRFVRKVFSSFLKRQAGSYEDGFQKEFMQKLQDIEDMIAREMSRQSKRRE